MNKIALTGTTRTNLGTKYAAQLRRTKQVPCVLYGGESTVHFSLDEVALNKVVFTGEMNGVEIDLDDGVKKNYPKFGQALKKIPGLEEKEE